MITTIQSGSVLRQNEIAVSHESPLKRFLTWADGQHEYRLVWLGAALMAHASVLTPFTVMAVVLLGNQFSLVMMALAAMAIALVPNLAALPTRVTIPAFLLSIIMDIAIVIAAFSLSV